MNRPRSRTPSNGDHATAQRPTSAPTPPAEQPQTRDKLSAPASKPVLPHRNGAALLSIGYERRDLAEMVALLAGHNVLTLIDVRLNPISRKKGFSKTALSDALAAAGIEYRHERELGNPKANRQPFRQGLASARARYRRRLAGEASDAFNELVALAAATRVALLCYERDHKACHRSCITDAARAGNPEIRVVVI